MPPRDTPGYHGSSFRGEYRKAGVFNPDGSMAPAAGTVAITPQGESTITKTLDPGGEYHAYLGHFNGHVTVVESIEDDPDGVRTTVRVLGGGGTIDTSREV